MNFFKFILLLIGIGLGVYFLFWLFFGIVSTLLWYAFWLGLIGLGGYVGYKLFLEKDGKQPQLQENKATAIAEMHNLDRVLEEFKQKELRK